MLLAWNEHRMRLLEIAAVRTHEHHNVASFGDDDGRFIIGGDVEGSVTGCNDIQ